MRKVFGPLAIAAAAMFLYAPIVIAQAPFESTMLMVQKIFYFHVPSWIGMYSAIFVCAIASTLYLFKGNARADRVAGAAAELAFVFGIFGLVTGSLWGRKAWGVWWQWDARLTTALLLELILLAYLILRRYGGPGSEKLAAGVALFAAADSVIVYKAVDWWRTIHPLTSVVRSLGETSPEMYGALLYCSVCFILLFALLLMARVGLEERRAELDQLYLAEEP
ncbi:MAG: cytochrome c biogenesis protein CcsA [Vicinamibacterales bacterium]